MHRERKEGRKEQQDREVERYGEEDGRGIEEAKKHASVLEVARETWRIAGVFTGIHLVEEGCGRWRRRARVSAKNISAGRLRTVSAGGIIAEEQHNNYNLAILRPLLVVGLCE